MPARVFKLSDATAWADPDFAAPVDQVCQALQQHLEQHLGHHTGAPTQALQVAPDQDLAQWRQAYAVAGAFDGWQTHGAWITHHQPTFGAAVTARWRNASQTSAEAAAQACAEGARIRAHVRALLGEDGIAVLPSAASVAPLRHADPAAVDAVRLRTMAITCIAGIAGLPQVSIPMRDAAGLPIGVSLMGPAGSDLALVRVACALRQRLL